MDISKKRIMADIKNLRKNEELIKCGIHVKFNEYNIYNAQAMILGPADTPYEKGFYFFDINFPSDYPMNPPKVKFCTLDGHIRFNPNLYACGKVCLSIIGTWSGPGWTSCLTLSTVLVSIQSLLNENPITNEPGFEKEPLMGEISKTYNKVIAYNNIRVSVIKMLEKTPFIFDDFQPIMVNYFNKYIDFYKKYIDENMYNHMKPYSTRIYSMNGVYDIKYLEDIINYISHKYNDKSNICDVNTIENVKNKELSSSKNKELYSSKNKESSSSKNKELSSSKNKKKTPNENANNYDIGYIIKSQNDQREYQVKQMCFDKKDGVGLIKKIEFKKWILKK